MRARDYNKSALITAPALAILCVYVCVCEAKTGTARSIRVNRGPFRLWKLQGIMGQNSTPNGNVQYHNGNTNLEFFLHCIKINSCSSSALSVKSKHA